MLFFSKFYGIDFMAWNEKCASSNFKNELVFLLLSSFEIAMHCNYCKLLYRVLKFP